MQRGRRCVKHKWVFEIKRDGRFRARLVACGYSQVAGVDFTEVFSPVVNDVSLRLILIYQILHSLHSLLFDIQTAFLHGELSELIYMDCPDGMDHKPDECLLLIKTIYGLVQSARQFYMKFKSILVGKMKFKECPSDPCLFMRHDDKGICFVLLHVDDCYASGTEEAIESVVKEIQKHGLAVTVDREISDYLSCEIIMSKDKSKAWIGQPHMIKKIKNKFSDMVKGM